MSMSHSKQSKQRERQKQSSGQALVVLLFYMIIAMTLTTTAVAVIVSNSLAVTQEEVGNQALVIAEAGAENALLKLIRNTNYTGEILTIASGSATVTVSGDSTKTITSTGNVEGVARVIQVTAGINNGVMTVTSWQEQ